MLHLDLGRVLGEPPFEQAVVAPRRVAQALGPEGAKPEVVRAI